MTEMETGVESAGMSSQSEEDRREAMISAINMLAQGKRNIVCGEVPIAVNQFQEACRLLSKIYGETARECAEAYLCYGQALLDLARMETGVLGNALQGVPIEEAEEESDEKTSGDEKDDESVDASSSSKESKDNTEEEDEEEEDEEEDVEEGDTAEEGEKSQDEEDKKGEEADDVPNLQLAWEMLELAKLVFLKQETKEGKLKAAEANLKLGEVSLETEQYEQAIGDFNDCLKIQKEYLEPEDRLLAETHYQLGLALGLNNDFEKSVEHYELAVKVIQNKIEKLSKIIEEGIKETDKKESTGFDDPITSAKKEIEELKELIPDIKSKIEDIAEEKKDFNDLKSLAKEAAGSQFLGSSSSEGLGQTSEKSSAKPVSDISHLIRRKRKPEDDEDEGENKKIKKDDGAGDASVHENGIKNSPEKKPETTDTKKTEEANKSEEPETMATEEKASA